LFRVSVAQPWLRHREIAAALANLVEGAFDLFFFQTKNRRIHAPDSLLRKARVTTIFTKSTYIAVAFLSHHHQPATGTADSHDASRFYHLVQPAMKNLCACLRLRFLQTRARADEALETEHC